MLEIWQSRPSILTSKADCFARQAKAHVMPVATMVSLLLYHRAASAGFINFDDPQYVINNPHVQQGIRWETIQWAFITFDAGNWHPLTWLSHALDCSSSSLSRPVPTM